MLTAKDMQKLLQVDRSTIYRMAEAQQLPALKIGRQWRFPSDKVEVWLKSQSSIPAPAVSNHVENNNQHLASLLPLDCVQLILDAFAESLGVMLVVTDMQGQPITAVSNPCGLFKLVEQTPQAISACISDWAVLGEKVTLKPELKPGHLGLLGARGMIRVGAELKGMVITGGIAPVNWPPSAEQARQIAAEFNLSPEALQPYLNDVFYLNQDQQTLVVSLMQRIADILAHITAERTDLLGKLNLIAQLVN